MPDLRAEITASARELVGRCAHAAAQLPLQARVTAGRTVCLIQVWDEAAPPGPPRQAGQRLACRLAVLEVVRAAGRPRTREQVVKALRQADEKHGPGTVAKALADLTRAGELVNPRDHRGYRLPEAYRRTQTPSLFEAD